MNKTVILTAAAVAFALIAAVVIAYVLMFGTTPVPAHDKWGQFGDFFAGLLNPLFAMLAFLALLWSITLQAHEFRVASKHLSDQTAAAKEQLRLLQDDRIREELLHVVKEVDSRLKQALEINVSAPGSYPQVTITLMVAEAQRLARHGGESPAYVQFLQQAQTAGSIVEAAVREVIYLVGKMREFLERYSQFARGSHSPVILYYADKVYQLVDMLEGVGGIPPDTRQFFATISDSHG